MPIQFEFCNACRRFFGFRFAFLAFSFLFLWYFWRFFRRFLAFLVIFGDPLAFFVLPFVLKFYGVLVFLFAFFRRRTLRF